MPEISSTYPMQQLPIAPGAEPGHPMRMVKIVFSEPILPHEIPALRGAISAKVGYGHVLFSNHDGDKLRFAYPLIQYKRIRGKAALICVDQGVDEIHHYFMQRDWSVSFSGRTLDMKVEELDLKQYVLAVQNRHFDYEIQDWLALNGENYQAYRQIRGLAERTQFLERKLTGNMLAFAKGVNWFVDKPLEVRIHELGNERSVPVKGVPLRSIPVRFSANVFLPEYIGLGAKVSLGFGVVRRGR